MDVTTDRAGRLARLGVGRHGGDDPGRQELAIRYFGFDAHVQAWRAIMRRPVDMDVIDLDAKVGNPRIRPQPISIKRIIDAVSHYYGIPANEIISHRRHATIVPPRHVVMYLARTMTSRSFPEIGRAMNGRDHTTIVYGSAKIAARVAENDPRIIADIGAIKALLGVYNADAG